ncbi:MAG: hypothetical protein ACTHZX_03400 [Microbacterium sp.]
MTRTLRILAPALAVLALAGCAAQTAGDPAEAADAVSVVAAKSVPPLLPVAALTTADPDGYEAELGADPDFLRAQLSSGSADIGIMPTEAAAALYNGGVDIRLIGAVDLRLLHVVAPSGTALADLERVDIAFPGDTADNVLRTVLAAEDLDPEVASHATIPDVLTGLASGSITAAVLPEHFATVAIAQSEGKLDAVTDLRDAWMTATGLSSAPQIAVVATGAFVDDEAGAADSLAEHLAAALSGETPDDVVAEAAWLAEVDEALASGVATRVDPVFLDAEEASAAVPGYLEALLAQNPDVAGGSLPDDGFYARS